MQTITIEPVAYNWWPVIIGLSSVAAVVGLSILANRRDKKRKQRGIKQTGGLGTLLNMLTGLFVICAFICALAACLIPGVTVNNHKSDALTQQLGYTRVSGSHDSYTAADASGKYVQFKLMQNPVDRNTYYVVPSPD